MAIARAGDLVLLLSADEKRFFVRLTPGEILHTHKGQIAHDDLIDQPLGREIQSHTGAPFLALIPSIHDLVMSVRRATQIVYPKDIGYILLKMNIVPGTRVVEAGTGSGALTTALARYVAPTGRVYSYEAREDMYRLAMRNLARTRLDVYVDLKLRDIAEGFDERDADALFLDVRTPWMFLEQAAAALRGGGFFGALVPTTNQVVELLKGMENGPWGDLEVCEILLRRYKAVPERLRPEDRLTPHTGYLIFARKLERSGENAAPEASQEG